jgi:hypothetical protein
MNLLSLENVFNVYSRRRVHVNYLHFGLYMQVAWAAVVTCASRVVVIPEVHESRSGVLLERVVIYLIILSFYLTACRLTVLSQGSINTG